MTEWRVIPGFTRYEASDDGQVRSVGFGGRRGQVLKQTRTGTKRRYWSVSVHDDGRGRQRRRPVHVLALLAHVGPRPDGMVGRHRDDDRKNNTIGNLLWGTPSQNTMDMVRNGNHHHAVKTHCPQGHAYDYTAPSGKGGRQCSTCSHDRSRKRVDQQSKCKNGHPYPPEVQERIADRAKRRYCPTCIANRKPRHDRKVSA